MCRYIEYSDVQTFLSNAHLAQYSETKQYKCCQYAFAIECTYCINRGRKTKCEVVSVRSCVTCVFTFHTCECLSYSIKPSLMINLCHKMLESRRNDKFVRRAIQIIQIPKEIWHFKTFHKSALVLD